MAPLWLCMCKSLVEKSVAFCDHHEWPASRGSSEPGLHRKSGRISNYWRGMLLACRSDKLPFKFVELGLRSIQTAFNYIWKPGSRVVNNKFALKRATKR